MNKPDEEAALLKDYVMIVDLTRPDSSNNTAKGNKHLLALLRMAAVVSQCSLHNRKDPGHLHGPLTPVDCFIEPEYV